VYSASCGGRTNLALSGTATSTSTQNSGVPASYAIDGSTTTRWSSVLNDSSASITVDLGALAAIDSVAFDWEAAYPKKYSLLASRDGSKWDTLYTNSSLSSSGWDGHSVSDSARYVRMQGRQVQHSYYGYSLYEFQVYGSAKKTAASTVAASKRFFMPHHNETQYWWQGENARLGSMSTALLLAGRAIRSSWTLGATDSLSQEGLAGLDWVLGKNSAGVNFLYGVNDSGYTAYNGGTNVVGGICNGIAPVSDADQTPVFYNNGGGGFSYPYNYWHWTEQWLPHDAWFLLGAASAAHLQESAPDVGVRRVSSARSSITVVAGSGLLRASAASSSDWTLLDPSGRAHARVVGATSAEFAPGRGTWIVEAVSPDGIRQSRIAVLP